MTVGDLLVKVVAVALAEHPQVNSSWQKERIVPAEGIHVGIAVALDDGLVVPVVTMPTG